VQAIEQSSFSDTAWSTETFWSELAGVPDTRRYWVGEEDGEVVGYVGLMVIHPDADIQTIAVSSTHRAAGIGGRLLSTAVDEARARRCSQLRLEVSADNEPARHLYERHGFETVARRSNYYGQGRDALILRLRLSNHHDRASS
jgi:ribosomal-protein-alanine N-acetyltransferase